MLGLLARLLSRDAVIVIVIVTSSSRVPPWDQSRPCIRVQCMQALSIYLEMKTQARCHHVACGAIAYRVPMGRGNKRAPRPFFSPRRPEVQNMHGDKKAYGMVYGTSRLPSPSNQSNIKPTPPACCPHTVGRYGRPSYRRGPKKPTAKILAARRGPPTARHSNNGKQRK